MILNAGGKLGKALGLVALLTLAACEVAGPVAPPPTTSPELRPNGLVAPVPPSTLISAVPSESSRALSVHFQRLQNDLMARGLLRTDGGGPDTTFTDTVLARNFVRIALFDEFVMTPTGLRAQPTVSRLRRWEEPVKFTVQYGATIPEDQRVEDSQNIRN